MFQIQAFLHDGNRDPYSLQVTVFGLNFLFVLKDSYLAFLAYFQAKFVFKFEAELSMDLVKFD